MVRTATDYGSQKDVLKCSRSVQRHRSGVFKVTGSWCGSMVEAFSGDVIIEGRWQGSNLDALRAPAWGLPMDMMG